ncbi:autotransporter-associated N-terminal domain-containing protein [Fusobacterium sp. oral taxon 203]|uniref:autotransporter-associated N-terminal domain-containing protein n=1 Tax=Fusobacterium sp. oral taxon 203 TaxID=671211 RepID=UPI000B9277CF|nr:autotransporter-associated N-terminal domain-containing protein [Fusobacterium sp. oral taxon 203]ASS40385.1 autotransporter subunit beta [Fusobacterium sp. oral taxon 203]
MNKQEIEKSLKRYLKKRISYTFSLLIAFLITGGFAAASELNQEVLLSRIKEDREKLEKMLQENYKKEAALQKENLDILKEADFYVKPLNGALFSMPYFSKKSKNIEKEWQGTVRTPTEHDGMREKFNSLQKGENDLSEAGKYTYNYDNLSSGWINKNKNYGNTANAYDVEAKLFILPVVKAPVVKIPTAPVVSFTTPVAPSELKIDAPTRIDVTMSKIDVTAPTVNAPTVNAPAPITAPTLATVTVNEPNVAVNIGSINVTGPQGLNLPSLTVPTVTVNTKAEIPEGIKPPELSVTPPDSPEAPNFDVFSRARGSRWLGGSWGSSSNVTFSNYSDGFNNFDPEVTMDSGTPGQLGDYINEAPMFSLPGEIYGKGKGVSEIVATSTETTVDNHYTDIASSTSTQNLWGSDKWTLRNTPSATITYSPHYFPGVTAGTYVSNRDDRPNRYQHTWIFQGSPSLVKDMTITIGGKRTEGTTIFAQTPTAKLQNVDINLKGYAQVANLESEENHSLILNNVNINMENKKNTLVSISSVTINTHRYDREDHRNTISGWGAYQGDRGDGNSTGIDLGTTNLSIKSQESALYYIRNTDTHRWWGASYYYSTNASSSATKYEINPGKYKMYYPTPGNTTFKNEGVIEFIGNGNVGAWVANYAPNRKQIKQYKGSGLQNIAGAVKPSLKLGSLVKMQGDNNTAYYFASSTDMPNRNGVFEGNVNINVEIGTSLGTGGTIQDIGDSTGDKGKSEKNVAVFVASGQRSEMSSKVLNGFNQYYPATLSSKIDNLDLYNGYVGVNENDYKIWGLDISSPNPGLNNIGAYQLGENNNVYATIDDFDLSDFKIKFGKYSKKSIGVVAKNGTVINLGKDSTISDNADTGAEQNIMVYAEGVWFNPRLKWTNQPIDGGSYGTEAYRRGESITGKKYISDFNTTVRLKNNVTMGSIKSTALFAKDGAIIDAAGKDVTMNGYGSKAVLAYGVKNYTDIVDSNNANPNKQPNTKINVANITATDDGADPNSNIAAIAISQDGSQKGTGDVSVNVSGKVNVHGVAAFARGDKATVTIAGTGSSIVSGANSGLVATDGGTVNFGGGTIEHKIDKQVPFYSANGAKLNFNGDTTVNMYKGVVFYGNPTDFSANAGAGKLYNGMNKVTVNLKDHGVNLGVFKGVDLTWKGNTDPTYVNGIKDIPHVNAINGYETYWYSSSLENGKLTVEADVNRDSVSSGSTKGDGFNDIQMERERVILQGGKSVTSAQGRGMFLGSNINAASNDESGYTLKNGTFNISNGTNTATAAYVNFGHIITEKNGSDEGIIKVSKGVAAYGVNGSKIINKGTIEVTNSDSTDSGIAIMALTKTEGKDENYGRFKGKGNKWLEIENKGTIKIGNGTTAENAIGIYAKNNHNNTAARNLSTIHNEAPITLGDNSKAIVIQTTNTEGATLTLKDSTKASGQDIKVGKKGIGVYAEYSDIKLASDYGIAIKGDGVAIQTKGTSNVDGVGKTLNVEYTGAKDQTAMAMGFTGTAANHVFTNNINISIKNTGNAKTLVGLYASGQGSLINSGSITAENDGTYGILSDGVDVENTGIITVGDKASTASDAVGIYAKNASITTEGSKIEIQGNGSGNNKKPIGIYAVSDNKLTADKKITINQGAGTGMSVKGKKAIGIYVEDNSTDNNKLELANNSDITLTDTVSQDDRRIGIVLKKAKKITNITDGKITVGKNNIGIYNEDSILTHRGTLDVKHSEDNTQNIGIHNTGKFEFNVVKDSSNPGLIDVEGHAGTVGISAETKNATDSGKILLGSAKINVKATDMGDGKIPLGIYAKGNNLTISSKEVTSGVKPEFTVSPNAVGIYMNGDNTSKMEGINSDYKFNLSSENTKDRIGIGAYFTGGAYATTAATKKVEVTSSQTKTNSDGAIRPIGLFYGANSTKNEANINVTGNNEVIGMYGKDLSTFTNSGQIDIGTKAIGAYFGNSNVINKGKVNVNADSAYGLYLKGGNSSTEEEITASGKNSVGALVTGNSAKLENKGGNKIVSKAENSIGVYTKDEAEFKNSGELISEHANSIGAYADGAKLTNSNLVESKNVGLYAKSSSTVTNSGTIDIKSGNGIVATDKTTVDLLANGEIKSVVDKANGIIATNKTTVNLSGTNIELTGDKSNAIYSDKNSTVNLTNGNVTVGKESLGVYTNNGSVNLASYTGTFTLGEKSVGIYSKASTINGGTLKIAYNHNTTGVGIFYDGGTVTNNTVIQHTGKNLVNILSKGANLTNTANQTVQENSLGIYADGGEVTNSGTLTLAGEKSVGFYLNNGAKLNAIGTITGSAATNYKVGIYAKNGSIEGKGTYNFAIDNGVAMHLDDNGVNNFTGTLNMAGNSTSGRAVGIYTTASTTARNINTNINLSGKNAIGMLLSGDGTNGSTVNYGGTLDLSAISSATGTTQYGIGALVQNKSTFNLSSTGKVKIGGVNNIGFFVQSGGTLQVSGGTVENTKEGIFAYLEDGQLDFKAGTTPNINFLNVFVSGSNGSIQNATAITVGTKGLQANNGAKITNTSTGTINGAVDEAKALVGTGNGTQLINQGAIKLDGEKSVAMYTNDNAIGTSSGTVEVGKKSVAYYVKDKGAINVSGTTKVGEDSTIFYVDKGKINYTGNNIVLSKKSTGLTLAGTDTTTLANFNGKTITTGENGTGIYITKSGELNTAVNSVQNLAKINVGKSGKGIYINNDKNFQSNISIGLTGEESIGILSTKNGNVNYSGKMDSTTEKVKGIVHTGSGDTINSGDIKLTGDSSIGVYAAGGNILENTNKIEIGKGISTATAVGLYAKNQTSVKNSGSIKMLESAIGIYGENSTVENTGNISNSGKNNNGIYAKDSNVTNSGNISLGDSSNGIYAISSASKTITNSGNITVGNKESSGIFGAGKTGINNLGGTIKTGSESVGLATQEGKIEVASITKFDIGKSSTYIYTEKGAAVNNANLSLSDYSIGMYTKEGTIKNKANVTVGKSLVQSGKDPMVSVGMAVEKGTIENYGTIDVPNKHGVGMVANNGGTAINRAGATINANGELSYGMQATKSSTLINEGTINVSGKDARGIAATNNSKIKNTGIINVSGEKAQGVFVDFGSEIDNIGGTINVNSSTGTGILAGTGGVIKNNNKGTINLNVSGAQASREEGSSKLEAGDITIKGPKAYIDNVEIQNSGTININGPLDLGTIKLGSAAGHVGTINAESFNKGKFMVLPNATLGSNKDMYTIQYLGGIQNVPNNGYITAISYSATFVADIQKDPVHHNITRIVLVRIPYTKLLAGTDAAEFGKGLDDLYKGLSNKGPQDPEQKIFDALKMISNKDQLGATFDRELRGNTYANVQRRMLDINETFSNSYENLKNSNLYARGRFKTGAIITSGDAKDKNPAVENYKTKTTGLIVMKEKDFNTYGRSADVSLAFTETNFKFDYGSKEKVHSLQVGVGFENFITDKNWKYSTRGEFTVNRHNMKRKIHLSNGVYENKGKYWSETVEWKNKLRYEFGTSGGLVTAGAFGTFSLGYGKFNNIKENGDGAELEIKSNNMYMVRPGVGVDLGLNYYTKGGKVSLVGIATAEYETGKVYDGVNQARIKKSKAGYYDLEKPKEIKDIYKVGAQVQYETNAGHKIGVGVVIEAGSVNATKYGINAVYKF